MNTRAKFWLITAAAVLGIAVTLSLGRWQIGRAAQKLAINAEIQQRAQLAPLSGSDLAAAQDPAALWHRPVRLAGRWRPEHTVFLDNRQMTGRSGFYVLTPLQLEGGAAVVLVQRGWVPRNFLDRSLLPPVVTPAGRVQIQGRIAPPPSALYELGAASSGTIRQNLPLESFRRETGLALLPLAVLQTDPASEGLLRDWPAIVAGVDKHHGYAFQWFGLSALITLLYVWFQIGRRFSRRR